MEEEAKRLIELHYNIIEKFVDDNYRDIVAKELAINHCELMIGVLKTIYAITSDIGINHYTQLKEKIKQI